MQHFDIIIVGAGPAGLLLAHELGKKHDILVLERGSIGTTRSSWITYEDRWEKLGFPKKLITNKFKEWHNVAVHDGVQADFVNRDSFICVDEHGFLKYLAANANVQIHEHEPLESYVVNNGVVVNGMYQCKLLVDCSGIGSVVARNENLVELAVYLNLRGCIVRFSSLKNRTYYKVLEKAGSNFSMFGCTKVAPRTAFLVLFEYSTQQRSPGSFEDVAATEGYSDFEMVERKGGSYPTGVLKQRSLDHIYLFGDAGFYCPFFTGMGFNEILRQHKHVANHLDACLAANTLDARSLDIPLEVAQQADNLFLQLFGVLFNYAPPDVVVQGFERMSKIPPQYVRHMMRNTLSQKDIFHLLVHIWGNADFTALLNCVPSHVLASSFKTMLALGHDILYAELQELLLPHNAQHIPDIYLK